MDSHATYQIGSKEGLVAAFRLSFLFVVVGAVVYSGLGHYPFAFWNVVHKRLNRRLLALWKACYLTTTAVFALTTHVFLAGLCATHEPCDDRPLDDKFCIGGLAAAICTQIGVMALDRVAVPLLDLYDEPSYPCTLRERVVHASAICIAWMCVANAETLGILLMLALTARRALNYTPFLSGAYTGLIKLYVFGHTILVLQGECHSQRRALPVAILGAMFVI